MAAGAMFAASEGVAAVDTRQPSQLNTDTSDLLHCVNMVWTVGRSLAVGCSHQQHG